MESMEADAKKALRQARHAIDGALSRERGRLLGLWSRAKARLGSGQASSPMRSTHPDTNRRRQP